MGELVDELEGLGYVERRPDPTDRRAKLIVLTALGRDCIAAGIATIQGIEERIDEVLGRRGHAQQRRLLTLLLDDATVETRPSPTRGWPGTDDQLCETASTIAAASFSGALNWGQWPVPRST